MPCSVWQPASRGSVGRSLEEGDLEGACGGNDRVRPWTEPGAGVGASSGGPQMGSLSRAAARRPQAPRSPGRARGAARMWRRPQVTGRTERGSWTQTVLVLGADGDGLWPSPIQCGS